MRPYIGIILIIFSKVNIHYAPEDCDITCKLQLKDKYFGSPFNDSCSLYREWGEHKNSIFRLLLDKSYCMSNMETNYTWCLNEQNQKVQCGPPCSVKHIDCFEKPKTIPRKNSVQILGHLYKPEYGFVILVTKMTEKFRCLQIGYKRCFKCSMDNMPIVNAFKNCSVIEFDIDYIISGLLSSTSYILYVISVKSYYEFGLQTLLYVTTAPACKIECNKKNMNEFFGTNQIVNIPEDYCDTPSRETIFKLKQYRVSRYLENAKVCTTVDTYPYPWCSNRIVSNIKCQEKECSILNDDNVCIRKLEVFSDAYTIKFSGYENNLNLGLIVWMMMNTTCIEGFYKPCKNCSTKQDSIRLLRSFCRNTKEIKEVTGYSGSVPLGANIHVYFVPIKSNETFGLQVTHEIRVPTELKTPVNLDIKSINYSCFLVTFKEPIIPNITIIVNISVAHLKKEYITAVNNSNFLYHQIEHNCHEYEVSIFHKYMGLLSASLKKSNYSMLPDFELILKKFYFGNIIPVKIEFKVPVQCETYKIYITYFDFNKNKYVERHMLPQNKHSSQYTQAERNSWYLISVNIHYKPYGVISNSLITTQNHSDYVFTGNEVPSFQYYKSQVIGNTIYMEWKIWWQDIGSIKSFHFYFINNNTCIYSHNFGCAAAKEIPVDIQIRYKDLTPPTLDCSSGNQVDKFNLKQEAFRFNYSIVKYYEHPTIVKFYAVNYVKTFLIDERELFPKSYATTIYFDILSYIIPISVSIGVIGFVSLCCIFHRSRTKFVRKIRKKVYGPIQSKICGCYLPTRVTVAMGNKASLYIRKATESKEEEEEAVSGDVTKPKSKLLRQKIFNEEKRLRKIESKRLKNANKKKTGSRDSPISDSTIDDKLSNFTSNIRRVSILRRNSNESIRSSIDLPNRSERRVSLLLPNKHLPSKTSPDTAI